MIIRFQGRVSEVRTRLYSARLRVYLMLSQVSGNADRASTAAMARDSEAPLATSIASATEIASGTPAFHRVVPCLSAFMQAKQVQCGERDGQ